MDNHLRTSSYKRLNGLDELLNKVNRMLQKSEIHEISQLTAPKLPLVLIVGNPRSGTTLLYQWLSSTGLFAYPSNIMSRFYNAPYIGGLIHKILVDYDKHGELCGNRKISFTSQLGKTNGANSPHEFWYFWRRFFHFGAIHQLNETELTSVNHKLFLKELAAIEKCFEKPVLLKALIMNWNIEYLNFIIPNPIFLFIKRNAIHNMASLYKARKMFFNDPRKWYSFKPPEFKKLKRKSIYKQLAGQVCFTNKHIERTLQRIQHERRLIICYEEFCKKPKEHYELVCNCLSRSGYLINKAYSGPSSFRQSLDFDNEFNIAKAENALSLIEEEFN